MSFITCSCATNTNKHILYDLIMHTWRVKYRNPDNFSIIRMEMFKPLRFVSPSEILSKFYGIRNSALRYLVTSHHNIHYNII